MKSAQRRLWTCDSEIITLENAIQTDEMTTAGKSRNVVSYHHNLVNTGVVFGALESFDVQDQWV